MSAGIKSLGPALAKAFGPLFLIQQALEAFIKIDKLTGDIAKEMNMSYHSALETTQELTYMANSSGSIFVTTKGIAESYMSINKTLGTSVMLNKELLVNFTKLREIAGMTNEELMGIASISLATGKSLEDNTKEFLGQATVTSTNNGILLNTKELLKSINKISAATTLSLGKDSGLMAKTVATAKSLGIEMSKIEDIADHMMDFESSIESELQAELLLGRDITLEKARQAALNNDLATLATEIANQVGNANEFGNMNLIQQESIAKSVGMSREELAKTLFIQEQLKGISGDDAEIKQDILNKRIEEVGLAQAQKELGEEGFEALKNQASMGDRFSASMEKLKEVFVSLVEPLMPVLDVLTEILGVVGIIIKLINPVLQTVGALGGLVGDLFGMLRGDFDFSGLNKGANRVNQSLANDWGLGMFAGDIISPANGHTQISTKEGGLFNLSKNDDVVAAPGIINKLNQPSNITNSVSINMSETNTLLRQILTKQGTVQIDNTKNRHSVCNEYIRNTINNYIMGILNKLTTIGSPYSKK